MKAARAAGNRGCISVETYICYHDLSTGMSDVAGGPQVMQFLVPGGHACINSSWGHFCTVDEDSTALFAWSLAKGLRGGQGIHMISYGLWLNA
jgi:hypothetical protein